MVNISNVAKSLQRESQKGLDVGERRNPTLGEIPASLVGAQQTKNTYVSASFISSESTFYLPDSDGTFERTRMIK